LVTGPAWTNLLVLLGMVWAIVSVSRLLSVPVQTGGSAGDPPPKGWAGWLRRPSRAAVWGPQLLIGAGFWLSRSTDTLWVLAVVGTVAALCGYALRILGRSADPGAGIDPPALATVLATTVLVQLGALLAVRLVVVPDPEVTFGGGASEDAWSAGWHALVQPFLGVAVLLVLIRLATADTMVARFGPVRQIRQWCLRLVGRADGGSGAGRSVRRGLALAGTPIGATLVVTPFLLPLLGGGDGSEPEGLTFLGIATPEFGKLLFLPVLAIVVARDSHRFDGDQGLRLLLGLTRTHHPANRLGLARAVYLTLRFALYPLALFTLVALASGLRHDFGTLVSVLAATIAVTWAATRHVVGQLPDAGEGAFLPRLGRQLRRTLSAYRLFLGAGAALLLVTAVVTLVFTDYVHERAQVWADPWVYRWAAGCVPPDAAPSTLMPHGVSLCQRSLAADAESERAQVAIVLSAVADGGVWGRGLRDTASGTVPAGSTDFILAVMWNKLGGFVVLLSAVLTILLGAALRRTVRAPVDQPGSGPTPAKLFATGLAAMVVGQFLFVFAATVNLVPHSGIPAPLLSRGGQSTLAIVVGVAAVLLLGRVSGTPGTRDAPWARAARPALPISVRRPWTGLATVVPVALCVLAAVGVTVNPYPAPLPVSQWLPSSYDERRPPCPARGSGRDGLLSASPDPATCSTDRIAYNRTRIDVRFGDQAGLLQRRPSGQWKLAGGGDLGGLTIEDLAGLLRVGSGDVGVVDQSYPRVVDGTAGTDLSRRLSPVPEQAPVDGGLTLTIRPRWQHVAATALRTAAGPGIGPLAGAIVVIDARTGEVLVNATAPGERLTPPTADTELAAGPVGAFLDAHPYYARLGPGGTLDGSTFDDSCRRQASAPEQRRGCWEWSVQASPPPAATGDPDLRRWVENDARVEVPSPAVNRALGQWYGLGSTFKVVIAAAYLRAGGTARDLIDAPDVLPLAPGVVIHNASGGRCPGTDVDGRITLTRALAVSCNTAFVGLARRIGWPRIAEQARLFGFHVGPCDGARPWLTNELTGAVGSCVPADADDVAIGNDALGGQDVQGTPLQLATVMAAVANQGRAVQPTLVSAVRVPGTGRLLPTPPGTVRTALPPDADAQLVEALSRTAVDGTAAGLRDAVGTQLWIKTGTHEVVPAGKPLPAGQFVRQDAWVTGFLDGRDGPMAFAVVVETRDERTGAKQARFLAETIAKMIRGVL
jgi:cell division protein FtsI/penicillin-binding protein 2/cell division protein FtsW (lipid II flippase)